MSCAWDSAINMAFCLGVAVCLQDMIPIECYTTSTVSAAHHAFRTMLWIGETTWEHMSRDQKAVFRKKIHMASSLQQNESGFKSLAQTVDSLLLGSPMATWTFRLYNSCIYCGIGGFTGPVYKGKMVLTNYIESAIKTAAQRYGNGKLPLTCALQYWSGTGFSKQKLCQNSHCRRRLTATWKCLDRLPRYLLIDDIWMAKLRDCLQLEESVTFTIQHESMTNVTGRYILRGIHVYLSDQNHFEYYGKPHRLSTQWYRWGDIASQKRRDAQDGKAPPVKASLKSLFCSNAILQIVIYEQILE